MSLADTLAMGVAASRRGAWQEAEQALSTVYADETLANTAELQDVRARVCSLYAQALLECGRPTEADGPCRAALRILRKLRDKQGVDAVRKLQDRIVKALVEAQEEGARQAERARIAQTSLDDLLRGVSTTPERLETMIKKANAMVGSEETAIGTEIAREALVLAEQSRDTHWAVKAHLTLAALQPNVAAQHVLSAYGCAEQASEFNLVSMVARAADLYDVQLPVLVGPHARPEDC